MGTEMEKRIWGCCIEGFRYERIESSSPEDAAREYSTKMALPEAFDRDAGEWGSVECEQTNRVSVARIDGEGPVYQVLVRTKVTASSECLDVTTKPRRPPMKAATGIADGELVTFDGGFVKPLFGRPLVVDEAFYQAWEAKYVCNMCSDTGIVAAEHPCIDCRAGLRVELERRRLATQFRESLAEELRPAADQ